MGIRTEISFELVCSKCGATLEADTEQHSENHRKDCVVMNSAMMSKMRMKIIPCQKCLEPVRQMRDALDTLDKLKAE